jgi:hypothetical protein
VAWRDYATFGRVLADPGYAACVQELYPTLNDVIANIVENTAIAVSRRYAIHRDNDGLLWLWRESSRVGLINGRDTVMLLKQHTNLRQEVNEAASLTFANIVEA